MNTLKDYVDFKLTHADKVESVNGYPLTMENCMKNKKMKQLKIYGNTSNVQSVGELVTDEADVNYGKYKIPVITRGKNLATAYDVCKKLAAYKETTLDGRECVMYQSDGWVPEADYYKFKENTQYTVSFDVKSVRWESLAGANCILGFRYTDGTFGKAYLDDAVYVYDTTEWRKVTITSQAGKTVMGITTDSNHYALRHYIDVNTFLLEESAFATDYEPYIEPVTTNVFMSEPLGTGEYIDFKNKKVVRDMSSEIIECQLPTLNAKTSIIEVGTSLAPSNIYGKYIKR